VEPSGEIKIMDPKTASLIRKVSLALVIVFDILTLVFFSIAKQWFCVGMFFVINIVVFSFEILSVRFTGKTVSTNITKALESFEKVRPIIYLALVSFTLSMVFLTVHWGVW